MIRRVLIIGAGGNLGRILVTDLSGQFEVISFSSSIDDSGCLKESQSGVSIEMYAQQLRSEDIVLFLSHSQDEQELQSIRQVLSVLCGCDSHLIFVSTMSIISDFRSRYSRAKLSLEQEVLGNATHFSIVRLGLVWGVGMSGLNEHMRFLAAFPVLIMPSCVWVPVIHFSRLKEAFLDLCLAAPSQSVETVFDTWMPFDHLLRRFGFRGALFRVSLCCVLRRLALAFEATKFKSIACASLLQSVLSLAHFRESEVEKHVGSREVEELYRLLVLDYVRLVSPRNLSFVKHYLKQLASTTNIWAYGNLTESEKFMVLVRALELREAVSAQIL